jgi:hypothetical protein
MVFRWLRDRAKAREAKLAAEGAEFARRLRTPDLKAVEQRLGHPLPRSLHLLYADQALLQSDNILIEVPNPIEESADCYIAWFEPGDLVTFDQPWPGCEGLFPIANNGLGDQFLIDPREADPEVLYHLHETGEKGGIGVTLSAFLAAPRKPVPDES